MTRGTGSQVRLGPLRPGAGLAEIYVDDGHEAYRLTDDGVWVAHMLAMGDESDAEAMLEVLLDAGEGASTLGATPMTSSYTSRPCS